MADEHSEIQPITNQDTEEGKFKETVAQESVDELNSFPKFQREDDAKGGEEQVQDYKMEFPDIVPPEVASIHTNTFKEVGIEADKAQKVIDALTRYEEQSHQRYLEGLKKLLVEDKKVLQQELGSDYATRERDISRYFYEENISDEDVQSLVSQWGFKKTFHFFDRYAQLNKESSAGDTFARSEGASSMATDNIFDNPEFAQKLDKKDPEALGKVKSWALRQAQMEQ